MSAEQANEQVPSDIKSSRAARAALAVGVGSSEGSDQVTAPRARAIISRGAQNGAPRRVADALLSLRSRGWEISEAVAGSRDAVVALARQAIDDRCDVVLAIGGDGTFAAVAGVLVHSSTILAPLPAGTANGWAREMGIPIDVCRVASLLPTGSIIRVDVGVVHTETEDHAFLATAGVGFDAAVSRDTPRGLKRWLGVATYALAAVRVFPSYQCGLVDVATRDAHITTPACLISVGNTRAYGGILTMLPFADNTDGLLDVCIFRGRTLRAKLLHAARTLLGRHVRSRDVTYLRVAKLEVDSAPPQPVQADGDYVGTTPVTITCHRQALRVLCPTPIPD